MIMRKRNIIVRSSICGAVIRVMVYSGIRIIRNGTVLSWMFLGTGWGCLEMSYDRDKYTLDILRDCGIRAVRGARSITEELRELLADDPDS